MNIYSLSSISSNECETLCEGRVCLREIAIVSGKGGVGKSSLTASLAFLLNKAEIGVTAVDCDVDAPNLSIILGANLQYFKDVQASEKASIDLTKCNGCGSCVSACKVDALMDRNGEPPTLVRFLCEGCGACTLVCPRSAITIERVTNGRIGMAETAYGFPIVSGELEIGESSSGHIVTAVKAKGRTIAEDHSSKLMLVDGPPGIGCPVIASVAGADYAFAVTEPTPAAMSSLDRMLIVLSHFNIPTSIVINRFDLNREYAYKIEDYVRTKWDVGVAQRIPLDENIPLSLSKRTPVAEFSPDCEASKSLSSLSDQIKATI